MAGCTITPAIVRLDGCESASSVLGRGIVESQKRKISASLDARNGFGTVAAAGGITMTPWIA